MKIKGNTKKGKKMKHGNGSKQTIQKDKTQMKKRKQKQRITTDNQSKTKMWFQQHWWLFIIGVFIYCIGFTIPHFDLKKTFQWESWASDACLRIGETILVGGIIAFFATYKIIIDGYKNELKSLLLGTEYLENRNDIGVIWHKVTLAFCKTKFPSIAENLAYIIKTRYLKSRDNIRCYHDYNTIIKIDWDSDDKKWIKITENTDFCLYTDTSSEVLLTQGNIIQATNKDDGASSVTIVRYDDKEFKDAGTYDPNTACIESKVQVVLQGRTMYDITKLIIRRYNIEKDNCINFKAKYITNNLSLKVSHPGDMRITFSEGGTINDFKTNIINDETCEYRYNKLILPRQGYNIFMSQKN